MRGRPIQLAGCLVFAALTACSRQDRLHNASNELPFGHVDVPAEGARVGATAPLTGWALDDRGVREIRVYVDSRFAALAQMQDPRPDVAKLFPQYARRGEMIGWIAAVAFDQPGRHLLLVQAVDSDGATRDIGLVNVTAAER